MIKNIFVIKTILTVVLLLLKIPAWTQYEVRGIIKSEADKVPLSGVSISFKGLSKGVISDSNGEFRMKTLSDTSYVLKVFSLGFSPVEIKVDRYMTGNLEVLLHKEHKQLEEIHVSTGYQKIGKERETGSYFLINNQLLNRRTGMNILERLEDIVPGLSFVKGGAGGLNQTLTIRGQSTIFANAQPLIVVDNFPFEGDLQSINPTDVENITILKDAAAASIWGARAGNGVIVITTKSGKFSQPLSVVFTSNTTISQKPDLYYHPEMSSEDFISLEQKLFSEGYFQSSEASLSKVALSPVTELLIALRDGVVSESETRNQLSKWIKQDNRRDIERYFYRQGFLNQISLNLSGGSDKHRYRIAFGHDKDFSVSRGNELARTSVNTTNSLQLGKLEVSSAVFLTAMNNRQNAVGVSPSTPYEMLVSEDGQALPIMRDLRYSFKEQSTQNGLLDWHYRPFQDLELADHSLSTQEYRINNSIIYTINPFIKLELRYQHGKTIASDRNHQPVESYEVRHLINRYSSFTANNILTRPIPYGGILDMSRLETTSNNGRIQVNLQKDWTSKHSISAIGGGEIMDVKRRGNTNRYYGYFEEHATVQFVDYLTRFPFFNNNSLSATIPNMDGLTDKTDRYLSYFTNGSYSYFGKYSLSASLRYDASNLFGIHTNQKGTPLYSLGAIWNINKESFYRWDKLNFLRLKLTYGANGNIDKSLSAYTTAVHSAQYPITGLPYAVIVNPPNPNLRWERVKMINSGLELQSKSRRLTIGIEYYLKYGTDLIGFSPMPSYSGVTSFRGNTANTKGEGLEFTVQTRQIDHKIKWYSDALFSWVNDKVTQYNGSFTGVASFLSFSASVPVEGRPLFSLNSFEWLGLDPNTGDPRGRLNGKPSTNYAALINLATPQNMVYHGSARPTMFGSIRNTFIWNSFSLSANVSYRLGYYFRRPSIEYGNNSGLMSRHGDYKNRWQKPGDESFTDVPSVPDVFNSNRDFFYTYSEILVEKGDHIRLQDVRLEYTPKIKDSKMLKNASIYLYANNLGILWKATSSHWDPDYVTSFSTRTRLTPPSSSISVGFTLNL